MRIGAACTRLIVLMALLVVAGSLTPAARASAPAPGPRVNGICATASDSKDWKSAVAKASKALSEALVDIQNADYPEATNQLWITKRQLRIAHKAATALVGKPPTDPESDDPPGVAATLKVSGLEHRVTVALTPLFGDPNGLQVIRPMAGGLLAADTCRQRMLARVIDLSPGKRDDYADGLADTLPGYDQELSALASALGSGTLNNAGEAALTDAQQVVSATQEAMNATFGGGE